MPTANLYLGPETALLLGNRKIDHLARVTNLPPDRLEVHYRRSASLGEFTERVLVELMRINSKGRWGEKTPSNVRCLDALFRFFPEARFIHIIRDGKDVVCSLRTHPQYRWEDGRRVPTGICNPWRQCVEEWVNDVRTGLSRRGDARYYEVRYESLVNHPEETLRPLLYWLEEPWEASILDAYRSDESPTHPGLAKPIHQVGGPSGGSGISPRRRGSNSYPAANELLVELGYAPILT